EPDHVAASPDRVWINCDRSVIIMRPVALCQSRHNAPQQTASTYSRSNFRLRVFHRFSGRGIDVTELDSIAGDHLKDVADSEYLRMISWLRDASPATGTRTRLKARALLGWDALAYFSRHFGPGPRI